MISKNLVVSLKSRLSSDSRRRIRRILQYAKLRKELVHFLHCSKTGGTALRVVLHQHASTGKYALALHNHSVTLKDIAPGEKVVFFVRDPVTRFVSGFYSRFRRGRPRHDIPWTPEEAHAFGVFTTPNELALALGAAGDAERDRAMGAMKSIGHVNSSYWDWFGDEDYFLSRRDDCFFIGFQETLDSDFEMLKGKLGLPNTTRLPTDDRETHRTPARFDTRLDEEAAANLRAWYSRDYQFVHLCKEIKHGMT